MTQAKMKIADKMLLDMVQIFNETKNSRTNVNRAIKRISAGKDVFVSAMLESNHMRLQKKTPWVSLFDMYVPEVTLKPDLVSPRKATTAARTLAKAGAQKRK
jgi:hypothetical protein